MTKPGLKLLWPIVLAVSLVGCNGGTKAPPNTTVRVTDVMPSYNTVNFRRAEETINPPLSLAFKGSVQATYNQDTYAFHVEVTPVGDTTYTRIVNFTKEVLAGTLYQFVLMEAAGAPDYKILEMPTPSASASDAEVIGLHAADGTPPVDVYIESPGTDVMAATPWGTVGYGQTLPVQNLAAGDYELTLTEQGNPQNIVLTTTTFTLAAATATSFVIAPEAGSGVEPLSVLAVQDTATTLYDKNAQSAVRVINTATDMAPRDVVLDSTSPPLFSAVPFGTQTDYALIAPGDRTLDVTPAGNPGAIELDQGLMATASQRYTMLIAGDAGALADAIAADDRRSIPTQASLHIFDAAGQFTSLYVYIVAPGTDITTVFPSYTLVSPSVDATGIYAPGDYDLVLEDTTSSAIVAGPQTIHLDGGGFYTVLAVNGSSSASADVILLDDFQ
jgi:hypothetical protein